MIVMINVQSVPNVQGMEAGSKIMGALGLGMMPLGLGISIWQMTHPKGTIAEVLTDMGMGLSLLSVVMIFFTLYLEYQKFSNFNSPFIKDGNLNSSYFRLGMNIFNMAVSAVMATMTTMTRKNVEKRIDYIKGVKSDVEKLTLEQQVQRQLRLSQNISQQIIELIFRTLVPPAKAQVDEFSDRKIEKIEDLKFCLDQKRQYDFSCSCRNTKTCLDINRMPLSTLPSELLHRESSKHVLKTVNDLIQGKISITEIDPEQMKVAAMDLRKLAQDLYEKKRGKLAEAKGSQHKYPPMDQFIQGVGQKISSGITKENIASFLKYQNKYNASNALRSTALAMNNKFFEQLQVSSLSKLDLKGEGMESLSEQVSLLKNNQSTSPENKKEVKDGGAFVTKSKFKLDSVWKNKDQSIWKIISNAYRKKFQFRAE